jgi:centromere protein C
VNAGVSAQKNNARQTKALASEPVAVHDFSDGEGDENANSFGQLPDDFGDSFDAGDETIIRGDGDEVPEEDQSAGSSPAAAPSHGTDKTKSTSKATKKGPTAKPSQPNNGQLKRRGRPPKSARPADDEGGDVRPPKKQKSSSGESQTTREPLDPELDRVVENYAQRSGPLKGRSLYILKRENPSDTSATHTRSGRVSVRPLAYWRNERCVFGDGEAVEGQRFPLSTIKEVIRTEDAEPNQQKKGKRTGRKSKKKKQREESSDEEDEDADIWEKEGVLHGYVPKWDPKAQASTSEEEVLGKKGSFCSFVSC